MAEATSATRHGRLLGVNLPAPSPFVNSDSAHHGPRREPLDAGDVLDVPPVPDSTRVYRLMTSSPITGRHFSLQGVGQRLDS
jgi:hypothetical protein